MQGIMTIIGHIMFALFLISLVAAFFAIIIVGPYFHKKFKHYDNPFFESSFLYPAFIARGLGYCVFILFKRARRRSLLRPIYGDLNFREHARTIDVVISYWLVGGYFSFLVTALFMGVFYLYQDGYLAFLFS